MARPSAVFEDILAALLYRLGSAICEAILGHGPAHMATIRHAARNLTHSDKASLKICRITLAYFLEAALRPDI
jgi:hypothetical protein